MILHDMISHDTISHYMISYDMMQYDVKPHNPVGTHIYTDTCFIIIILIMISFIYS